MNDTLSKQGRIDYEISWLKEEMKKEITQAEQEIHGAWLDALMWVNDLKEEGNA